MRDLTTIFGHNLMVLFKVLSMLNRTLAVLNPRIGLVEGNADTFILSRFEEVWSSTLLMTFTLRLAIQDGSATKEMERKSTTTDSEIHAAA